MSRRKSKKGTLLSKETIGCLAIGIASVLFIYVIFRDVTISNYFGMGEETLNYLMTLLALNITIFPIVIVDFAIGIICLKFIKDSKFRGIDYLIIISLLTIAAVYLILRIYHF